jgi:hypothetical protein
MRKFTETRQDNILQINTECCSVESVHNAHKKNQNQVAAGEAAVPASVKVSQIVDIHAASARVSAFAHVLQREGSTLYIQT